MKNDNLYIDKDDLHDAVREYYEADDQSVKEGNGRIQMPDRLGLMIYDIARFLMNSNRFRGYIEKDDMQNDVLLKLVDILHHKKFNLFGNRKQPIKEKKVIEGYTLPDINLNPNQKFCLLDENDPHTLSVFTKSFGFLVNNKDYYNTPKEISEVYDAEISSNKLNALNFSETITTNLVDSDPSQQINIKKIHMFNERGDISYTKDDNVKTTYSLKSDEDSILEIDCCYTKKIDNNHKRFLEEEILFFDDNGENVSMQKNNAFGYLSRSATLEVIKDIKIYNKRKNTLENYQKEKISNFEAENPNVKMGKMEDDTYDDWNE